MTSPNTTTPATVFLVGAGPGDPGLLTLRGAECLRRADLILYDYLVNPAMLEHVSPTAELIGLGHHTSQIGPDFGGIVFARVKHALKKARSGLVFYRRARWGVGY